MPVIFGPEIVEGKVYRGKRKNEDEEKQALAELQSILNEKNRRSCDCEAQVHDLLENCLNCGRLTCVAEGPGKCFSCGSIVLSQEQRDRLRKHVDILQSFPPSTTKQDQQTAGPRVRIIDNQFDEFAIENKRHLRGEEKRRLKENLAELQSKRYQRKLVLNVDVDNLVAESSSMPAIDDYAAEMRKLQISQPDETGLNPTLAEALQNKTSQPPKVESNSLRNIKDKQSPPKTGQDHENPSKSKKPSRGNPRRQSQKGAKAKIEEQQAPPPPPPPIKSGNKENSQ